MSTLSITLPSNTFITNGKHVTFKAPCDSRGVTGLYIDNDTRMYSLKDSRNNAPSSTVKVFETGAMVHVILDVDNHIAYLQNASGVTASSGSGDSTSGGGTIDAEQIYGLAEVAISGSYLDLEDVPKEFTPASHKHRISDIEGIEDLESGDWSAIGAIQANVSELQTDVNTLQSTVDNIGSNVVTLETNVGTFGESITGLQEDISDLQADVEALQEQGGGSGSDVSGLRQDVTNLQDKFNDYTPTSSLATVATSGKYSDLSGTPTQLTPSSHASTHATDGDDAITPASIGAATVSYVDTALLDAKKYADTKIMYGNADPDPDAGENGTIYIQYSNS